MGTDRTARPRFLIRWQNRTTGPVQAGDMVLRLQAQALQVSWPRGGFVWNRPVAVLVEGETETRLPIVDVTRLVQLGLVALVLGMGLLFLPGRTQVRQHKLKVDQGENHE